MAELIKMPTLGFDMEEGTMGVWLKEVGDAVAVGDVLAEIESDKVTQELQARSAGVLLARFTEEGDIIPVGADLGVIGDAGEDISSLSPDGASAGGSSSEDAAVSSDEEQEEASEERTEQQSPEPASGAAHGDEFPGGVKATPVARRLAQDKSADLKQINGTGPNGRIVKADVEKFLASGGAKQAAAPAKAEAAPAPKAEPAKPVSIEASADQDVVELTRLRKAIARRMTESKQTVPHFQVTSAIDMTDALALRKQINVSMPEGEKVTVNDLIVKASGVALRSYPNINATWGGDKLLHNKRINVGTAVAVEGGLLTIVQHDTDKSSIGQVARENAAKIARARDGKVQAEDIQGSTFSVSNLGGFDVYSFTAIINPPEATILAVGSANQEVVVRNGEMVIRNIMRVTLSADHRVTDGAEVAQFLQHLKGILENPMKLLI